MSGLVGSGSIRAAMLLGVYRGARQNAATAAGAKLTKAPTPLPHKKSPASLPGYLFRSGTSLSLVAESSDLFAFLFFLRYGSRLDTAERVQRHESAFGDGFLENVLLVEF